MADGEAPRRRDVLRAGAAAGLAGIGWATSGVSARDGTAPQDGEPRSVFSYGLQTGDRFQVQSRLRTPDGDPATETVPATCLDDGASPELPVLIVRAYRDDIRLGYEGLFAPEQALATEAAETTETEAAEETETTGETETTPAGEPEETTTRPAETTATETVAEAAIRDETTVEETTAEETTVETATATTVTAEMTETTETTAEANETTPADDAEADAGDEPASLPEIRVGEWYRVAEMTKCDSLSKMTLAVAEPPETETTDT